MTSKTKLIKFIQAKDRIIFLATGLHPIYKSDIQYIKSLPISDTDAIWKEIRKGIYSKKSPAKGYGNKTCPWCISTEINLLDGCDDCPYGITHGKCYESKVTQKNYASHYDKVRWYMRDNSINPLTLLSNKVFRALYRLIEEK